jgi:hypothetical protein
MVPQSCELQKKKKKKIGGKKGQEFKKHNPIFCRKREGEDNNLGWDEFPWGPRV